MIPLSEIQDQALHFYTALPKIKQGLAKIQAKLKNASV